MPKEAFDTTVAISNSIVLNTYLKILKGLISPYLLPKYPIIASWKIVLYCPLYCIAIKVLFEQSHMLVLGSIWPIIFSKGNK